VLFVVNVDYKNMSLKYVDISDAAAHACPHFIQNCDVS
jgi:hypothetical protein